MSRYRKLSGKTSELNALPKIVDKKVSVRHCHVFLIGGRR